MKRVLHLGYPKCASTFMQERLFARHPEVINVGKPLRNRDYTEFYRALYSLFFEWDLTYSSSHLKSQLQGLSRETKHAEKTLVMSDEVGLFRPEIDPVVVFRRLAEVFAPCDVVLVIRNQPSFIQSWYAYLGRYQRPRYKNREIPFSDWFAWAIENYDTSLMRNLEYDAIVGCLIDLFGAEHVHVLLYEDLVADEEQFVSALCRILAVDTETGLRLTRGPRANPTAYMGGPFLRLAYELGLDRLKGVVPNGIASFIKDRLASQRLADVDIHAQCEAVFGYGNLALARRLRRDLAQLGYPVSVESSRPQFEFGGRPRKVVPNLPPLVGDSR